MKPVYKQIIMLIAAGFAFFLMPTQVQHCIGLICYGLLMGLVVGEYYPDSGGA